MITQSKVNINRNIDRKLNLVGSRNELQYLKIKNLTSSSNYYNWWGEDLSCNCRVARATLQESQIQVRRKRRNFMFELNSTQLQRQKSICPNPIRLQPLASDKTQTWQFTLVTHFTSIYVIPLYRRLDINWKSWKLGRKHAPSRYLYLCITFYLVTHDEEGLLWPSCPKNQTREQGGTWLLLAQSF